MFEIKIRLLQRTVYTYLFEVIIVGHVVELGSLQNFRCDVVAKAIKHDVLEHFALFGGVLEENSAYFFKLLLWHRLYSFLDNP